MKSSVEHSAILKAASQRLKIILFIQFNYNILLWIKGDPIEFQFTVLIGIIILIKHYTNIINIFKK